MKFASKAVSKQGDNVLLSILSHALAGYEPARSFNKIHASMLTAEPAFCPREAALSLATDTKRPDVYITAAMRVAFDNGEAVHDLVRSVWLREISVGDWKCGTCSTMRGFGKYPKNQCDQCGNKNWLYKEVVLTHKTAGYTGSLDFLADLGMGLLKMVEIKTIDKDQYADLLAPMAEHRVRTALYLDLIKNSGDNRAAAIDCTSAKILYVSKGFGKKAFNGEILPFKEFDVVAAPKSVELYTAKAAAVEKYKTDGTMPKGICKTSFDPRAQKCCVLKHCWGSKYVAGSKHPK